jgi:excisionase family DNA binding protein
MELLTTSEAAKLLRLSRERVRQLCVSGEIKATRRGSGHWRVHKAGLFESHSVEAEQSVFEKPILTVPDLSILDRIDRLTR